jgi:hypothetical protein
LLVAGEWANALCVCKTQRGKRPNEHLLPLGQLALASEVHLLAILRNCAWVYELVLTPYLVMKCMTSHKDPLFKIATMSSHITLQEDVRERVSSVSLVQALALDRLVFMAKLELYQTALLRLRAIGGVRVLFPLFLKTYTKATQSWMSQQIDLFPLTKFTYPVLRSETELLDLIKCPSKCEDAEMMTWMFYGLTSELKRELVHFPRLHTLALMCDLDDLDRDSDRDFSDLLKLKAFPMLMCLSIRLFSDGSQRWCQATAYRNEIVLADDYQGPVCEVARSIRTLWLTFAFSTLPSINVVEKFLGRFPFAKNIGLDCESKHDEEDVKKTAEQVRKKFPDKLVLCKRMNFFTF